MKKVITILFLVFSLISSAYAGGGLKSPENCRTASDVELCIQDSNIHYRTVSDRVDKATISLTKIVKKNTNKINQLKEDISLPLVKKGGCFILLYYYFS